MRRAWAVFLNMAPFFAGVAVMVAVEMLGGGLVEAVLLALAMLLLKHGGQPGRS